MHFCDSQGKPFTIFILLTLLASTRLAVFSKDEGLIKTKHSAIKHVFAQNVEKTLRFNENHQFVILQLTDLHYGWSPMDNELSTRTQEILIRTVNPDLIVVTGDAVSGNQWDKKTKGYFRDRWEEFTAPYLKYQKLYAYIFGNHEAEADLNSQEIGELDKSHPYSLFNGSTQPDPKGYSNYNLKVLSAFPGKENDPTALLWMFDTRKEGCDDVDESYGCINKQLISWYKTQSEGFIDAHGNKISGLGFFHIPIPEFMSVWNQHLTSGSKGERVCCPMTNSGAFEEFRQTKNIKGLFCGHDHNNDYEGMYHGINLVYGRKSGYGSYGPVGQPGGRVIKLTENLDAGTGSTSFSYETFIVQGDGSFVYPEEPHWQGYEGYQTVCSAFLIRISSLLLLLVLI